MFTSDVWSRTRAGVGHSFNIILKKSRDLSLSKVHDLFDCMVFQLLIFHDQAMKTNKQEQQTDADKCNSS